VLSERLQAEKIPRSKVFPIAMAENWVRDIVYRRELGRAVSFVPDETAG
jgi:hypothetical protein